jgi:hypothetical protein
VASEGVHVRLRLRRIKIDREQVVADGTDVYNATKRAGEQAVKYVHDEIIRFGAVDSGALYNSIDYRIHQAGGNIVADVGPYKGDDDVRKYAKYVHDGTDGPIVPKKAKRMRVQIKGGPLLFLASVKGQEAKPFIRNALKKVRADDFY